jgi:hypothetical protein
MTKRTRQILEIILLAFVVLLLLGRLPSYSFIMVSGPEGKTLIEHTGPGPHTVRVEGPDGSVAVSGGW